MNDYTTEMELGKFFEFFGDVLSVKILEDKEGYTLGRGYVNFNDKGLYFINKIQSKML